MKNLIICFALTIFSMPAFSWVENANVTIDEVMMWESADTKNTHFKLSNGVWCYIPGDQKNLSSLVLAIYVSGKKVHIHCHDAADQNASGSVTAAHRLHRIIALKS